MNENQTTYPTGAQDEEEIDLVALMVTLLHKLKPILLPGTVSAALLDDHSKAVSLHTKSLR